MLQTRELACERGGRRLFSALNVALDAGGLLRVRGANGSGKTTLLRCLAGLTRPGAGSVHWHGDDIAALGDAYRSDLLFLGHSPAVKDELTVAENLDFSCRLSGTEISAAQLDRALDALGIAKLAGRPAGYLSQGQRRRAALARLALPGPAKLWLLDEPLAALDDEAIGRVRSLCAAHLAAGGLLVLTSHQEVEIAAPNLESVALGG